jgi:hypothetical protein
MLTERVCSTCTKKQMREWGCDAAKNEKGEWVNKSALPMEVDGEDSWACPRRPVKDDPLLFSEVMSHYGLYKEGVLADEGAINSQATKYVAVMRLVHSVVSECRAEQMESKK